MKTLLTFIASSLLATGLAAAPVRKGAVEAELVSAVTSIQPGQPFTVALRLKHDPHWHTYWVNAGTGFPSQLTWTLPAGFKSGSIEWPVPQIMRDAEGKVTGHGYEGEIFLPILITPPADLPAGPPITLRATAEWLMCKEVCMPGEANLALTLPVTSESAKPDPKWADNISAARQQQPAPLPKGWSAGATQKGDKIELLITAPGIRPSATGLRFLGTVDFIDYEAPQAIQLTKQGYRLELKVSEIATSQERLTGILRSDTGWGEGLPSALLIDEPIKR